MPVTDGMPWLSAVATAALGVALLAATAAALAVARRRRAPDGDVPPPRPVDPTSLPDDPEITATLDRRAVRRAAGRVEGERG
jgi:hypothetical protein